MSKLQFRRWIFSATPRTARLSLALVLVSGGATAAMAVPGVAEAVEAGKTVGGMTAQTLLGCITLGALALAGYCVKLLIAQSGQASQQHTDAIVALTKLGDHMESIDKRMGTMKCVADANK